MPAVNEPWFHEKLDYLCRIWEVSPIGFVDTAHGPVYLAEGWQAKRPDHPESGWTILWAVKHRGMCAGQGIYLTSRSTPEERKQVALYQALDYLGKHHGQQLAARFLERAS